MKAKMTVSELKQYVIAEATRLYEKQMLKESVKNINENTYNDCIDYYEQQGNPDAEALCRQNFQHNEGIDENMKLPDNIEGKMAYQLAVNTINDMEEFLDPLHIHNSTPKKVYMLNVIIDKLNEKLQKEQSRDFSDNRS